MSKKEISISAAQRTHFLCHFTAYLVLIDNLDGSGVKDVEKTVNGVTVNALEEDGEGAVVDGYSGPAHAAGGPRQQRGQHRRGECEDGSVSVQAAAVAAHENNVSGEAAHALPPDVQELLNFVRDGVVA
jgi:hypothetical protein